MMKNKIYINYKHLERLLTRDEYFVWNTNIEQILKKINNENFEEFEVEQEEQSLWEIFTDFDLDELKDYKFVEIIKNGFDHVNTLFLDYIQNWAKIENKNIKIVKEKSNELAFQKTMEYINDPNVDWIVNPIFIWEDLISKPCLYRKENLNIYSMVHASKTKLKHYIKAYFDFNVLKKLNILINEYQFFTYDKEKVYTKARDLSFISSPYCWTQKNGPSKDTKKTIEESSKNKILEKLTSGIIKETEKKGKNKNEKIIALELKSENFDYYIKQIRTSKEIKEKPEFFSWKNNTVWGSNPNFVDLFEFEKYKIPRVSGNLLNKENLEAIESGRKTLLDFAQRKKSLDYVLKNKKNFDLDQISNYITHIKTKKVVWYDFEGFSMPYTILPFSKPYQQLVFQLSIIRTENEKIIYKKNVVLDPLKIKINDFKNIIDEIYWKEADSYVVYNKSYEIPRIKEMLDLIEKDEFLKQEHIEYSNKISEIENRTIDLLDLFKITSSKENIPPIFIPDLLGFSSIKKLENYITNSKLQLEVMITPYKELEVQNGLMAMNKAIQRYLGAIGDSEWEKISIDLANYCENDVKAMIMVYFFVKYIYNENKN